MRVLWSWTRQRHYVPLTMAIGLLLVASVPVTYLIFWISPVKMSVFNSLTIWSHGLIPLLNLLPIWLSMILLYFITANLVASIAPVTFVVVLMAIVNRVKLELRGDPLVHWDFALIGEVLGVADGFDWRPATLIVGGVLAFIALSVFLATHIRTEAPSTRARALGTFCCALVMVILNATVYSSKTIEKSLPVWGSFYNLSDVHNSKGNLYSFIYNWNASRASVPDGYDPQTTRSAAGAYADSVSTELSEARPSLIFIMGEAFSGISESDAVDFSAHKDPLRHFKSLGEAGVSGSIVVPGRGGGTADTEHDVLTARPSRFLRNAPYAYRMLSGPTTAMPSMLSTLGYETLALHPGYAWFYNRQNVYPYLGFDQSVFEDAFEPEAYRDTYISEAATFDMLLELLREHERASSAPLMTFCLTIQNHAAYQDRFLPEGTQTFTPTVPMDDRTRNILSNYFAGISEADDELERLTSYLDTLDTSYVLVYFGDHLPSLDESLYDTLIAGEDAPEGSFLHATRLYTIPFIVWQNEAAGKSGILDMASAREALPENGVISSQYLGAYVLEQLGLDGLSPYWRYLNGLRRTYPVVMEKIAFTPDGEAVAIEDDEQLRFLRDWVYHGTDS
ncbi:LTA synthase family protein [Eubacteriales bacterium OttesenSCG-928-A19]|nr:LTA synthase family protein [Eubacteriales bacterium OttesenSCG-928-A19]